MSPIDNKSALAWRQTGDQAIIRSNDDPVRWRIYVASGVDELTQLGQMMLIYMSVN